MKTIQSRVSETKKTISISAKAIESNKISNDVDLFLADGGKIKRFSSYESNGLNELEKANLQKNKLKRLNAGVKFVGGDYNQRTKL